MKRRRHLVEGKPALELVEETIHLLRLAPARVFFFYYAGTLPFVLAFLYFWADMSRSAFAAERLPVAALVLSLLYLWMKTWQVLYARELLARIANEPTPSWSWRRWLQVCRGQAALQPLGLFGLPIALILFFPLAWVYAFFQNVTALGSDSQNVRVLFQRARRQAGLWPMQNHVGLAAWKGFGLLVVINLLATVFVIPFLLKTLFGFENAFTHLMQDPATALSTLFNTTLLTVLLALAYLCLDPLLKAFYVWRCFYGESLQTGHDLKTELRALLPSPLRAAVLAVFWLPLATPAFSAPAAAPPPEQATTAEVTAPKLGQTIKDVIDRREYSWRLPRPKTMEQKTESAFDDFLNSVSTMFKEAVRSVTKVVEKIVHWLGRNKNPVNPGHGGEGGWTSILHLLVFVLSVILVGLIVFMLIRLWHRRRPDPGEVFAQAVGVAPDLTDENVVADQLPEEGWRKLGCELLSQGELRLAMRAFYLASLAHLAERNLLTIAKFKSNHDYERELQRRGHALPTLSEIFQHNVSTFDRVWYGLHEVNRGLVEEFALNVERIRTG